jgi:hypothetical protein
MRELTQSVIERMEPLLAAGDTETAAALLLELQDSTALRAVIIHTLRAYGKDVAEAVATAFLNNRQAA